MIRSLAVLALATLTFAAGCAADPVAEEAEGATSSATTGTSDAALLARLEGRINNCHRLTDAEFTALRSLAPGPFSFSAQVYVYVSCKVESGTVVSASATLERRAGWSSSDGTFQETSMTAQTSINVPIRVVTASGTVAYEQTVRTAGGVTFSGESTSVGVSVERNFALARASVSADFNGTSASITGGLQSPIDIPMSACGAGGQGSFGARVSITAERNASDIPRAIRDKAGDLIVQNGDNNWVRNQLHETNIAQERVLCCGAQNTCD